MSATRFVMASTSSRRIGEVLDEIPDISDENADPGLQEPRNELLLKELRKDKYDIKDYSKIS